MDDLGRMRGRPGEHLNLFAGQFFFGREPSTVRTLLGSCVAVVLWHPQRRLGGMCHFLLPQRQRPAGQARDARYGDEALAMMVEALRQSGTDPRDYEAHLYGGADTMPDQTDLRLNIGERNIERGWSLIDHYGFTLQAIDVGDRVPRQVRLDLGTGEVEMRRCQGSTV
ncbi:chemotaxis protein CheD [Sphaerotilus hippei]|uniref:Probable chemoreceptor glutamine deamidase CheD n=1 Tax=Sphaerotilus hippei TaxID=744406 RepID=A0A318GZ15_9BURK|nr:chemotaxis protein CheD [Sphaerotilus hippei]PXW95507.1 chemotaxis protein CheD [Sphaerotilus hippei]